MMMSRSKCQRPLLIGGVFFAYHLYQYHLYVHPPPHPKKQRPWSQRNFLRVPSLSHLDGARAIEIIATNETRIWHLPSHHKICLQMDHSKFYTSCPYPDLMGRISGSSLAILDEWEFLLSQRMHHNDGTDFIADLNCGSYKHAWLPPGQYDLEIIVIFCNSFGLTSPLLQLTTNSTAEQWLEYDFKRDCLEDPAKNRLTSSSSTFTVEARGVSRVSSNNKTHLMEGSWRIDTGADYGPLSTRYQPQNCRRKHEERCTAPMNNSHLEEFNFVWSSNTLLEKLPLLGKHQRGSDIITDKICLVGMSDSRFLRKSLKVNGLDHHFIHVEQKFPSSLTTKFFEKNYHTHNCTKFVIGVGQWPASYKAPGRVPYSRKRWRDEITNVVTNEEIFKIDGEIKLFLRSVHLNPIGDSIGKCPPTDWRSPTVIDSYNFIMEELVLKLYNSRVGYLDTTFITKPLWDSSHDWCHLSPKVSSVESLYIAYALLVLN